MSDLVSIKGAVERKWSKLRLDKWANDFDHIEIYITEDGHAGPWAKFWSPINMPVCEQENPQTMFITMLGDPDVEVWRRYIGPEGQAEKPARRDQ